MNFLGILLLPFTLLYDLITRFRNYLYNSGYKRAFEFEANAVAVGNLSVGGTGKSPMVEYLIRLLSGKNIVTLSRGYGRRTRGFRLAGPDDSPKTIGDEPYQFYSKFEDIHVAVGEQRAVAIPFILAELPETDVILLDDAFQHRPVKPSLNILLTDYSKPFFKDYVLPTGRLRESRKGAQRADIIVVTKCPDNPDVASYQREIEKYNSEADVCFTKIRYMQPILLSGDHGDISNVFLFSGIANPQTLETYLNENYNLVGKHYFRDHHEYTDEDLAKLYEQASAHGEVSLMTTEKDKVKLEPLLREAKRNNIPLYYLPIETVFIEGGERFDERVLKSLKTYSY